VIRWHLFGQDDSGRYFVMGIYPMLRDDLAPAGIKHERGGAQIDFHSFRCYRVTNAILSGKCGRVVMSAVRLAFESLLVRYAKISRQEVAECVDAMPMPRLPMKVIG
jgi:hypothetical protein